jgi:hypothetical protein
VNSGPRAEITADIRRASVSAQNIPGRFIFDNMNCSTLVAEPNNAVTGKSNVALAADFTEHVLGC